MQETLRAPCHHQEPQTECHQIDVLQPKTHKVVVQTTLVATNLQAQFWEPAHLRNLVIYGQHSKTPQGQKEQNLEAPPTVKQEFKPEGTSFSEKTTSLEIYSDSINSIYGVM